MSSRFFVGLGAWLLGAVTATTGSMIAVNELAHGLLNAQAQQLGGTTVSADLEPGSSTTASARPARTPAARAPHTAKPGSNAAASGPSAQGPAGTQLESSEGSVMATCQSAGAYLVYWIPDQGFQAEDVYRGPAAIASVLFRGPAGSVVMRVTCNGDTPIAHVYHATDGGGGDYGGE